MGKKGNSNPAVLALRARYIDEIFKVKDPANRGLSPVLIAEALNEPWPSPTNGSGQNYRRLRGGTWEPGSMSVVDVMNLTKFHNEEEKWFARDPPDGAADRLTVERLEEARIDFVANGRKREIAEALGISTQYLSQLWAKHGLATKHPHTDPGRGNRRANKKKGSRIKLSKRKLIAARVRYANNPDLSVADVAKEFGFKKASMSQSWTNLKLSKMYPKQKRGDPPRTEEDDAPLEISDAEVQEQDRCSWPQCANKAHWTIGPEPWMLICKDHGVVVQKWAMLQLIENLVFDKAIE